jgi:hypothetical protein
MYVRDTDPLPRNSQDPQTACEAARAALVVSNMEQSVQNAYAASQAIAGPESFTQFGPAVVIDVARSQNARAAATLPVVFTAPNLQMELQAAPRVLPLNVSPEQYSGCSIRGVDTAGPVKVAPQTVTMPARMPAPVQPAQVATAATAPKWKNLCWAMRNGAVDRSQFDPAEFQKLSYACTQKGYQGACVPPPMVALWLDQQRRAGTLPHISVSQSDIDAIPAYEMTGVLTCPQSWAQGGLVGYRRGMGAAWGDAGSMPTTPGWPGGSSSVNWKPWAFFAAVGVGLFMMGKGGR